MNAKQQVEPESTLPQCEECGLPAPYTLLWADHNSAWPFCEQHHAELLYESLSGWVAVDRSLAFWIEEK